MTRPVGQVDTSTLDDALALLTADDVTEDEVRTVARLLPAEMARLRRKLGVDPVRVNGSRQAGLRMGYFQARLRDGTVGYFQRETSDCLRAGIASLSAGPDAVGARSAARAADRCRDGSRVD